MTGDSYKPTNSIFKSKICISSCLTLWFPHVAFLRGMLFLYTRSSCLTLLLHEQHWFPTFFSLHSLTTGLQVFYSLILCLFRKFFVAIVPINKIRRKMKDQIAQRNETTSKKWRSMLHVVGWHEKIGWHQTFGKCIVGVAFIFTRKISSKNEMKCQKLKV